MCNYRHYRLVVAGVLDGTLRDHFGGTMTPMAADTAAARTVYEFQVTDQTQLHGILAHLRDYAVPILQLTCLDGNWKRRE